MFHKIGSDHNELFEFNNLKLSDSILIFNFGEVDCRYHIGKQVKEKKRDLAEILDRLISNYLNFIQKIAIKSNCLPVVLSIIPPTNMTFNPQAPYYGTIEERVIITESLNAKLELACITNNILFIDPYRYFKDQNGFLIEDLSDKIVHVDPNINYIVKDFVLDVLTTRQLI